ncbi:MAG: TIGR03960 family B12-binding radical SAM protein [Treponema sp.]|nr:TIGR03960 family B12-binding radical SAM protein [Treponema sp.]
MNCIRPQEVFGTALCSVQNPSSYIGGEIGAVIKEHASEDTLFNMGIAFPDVYSIGMSNQAIKIIYNGLNAYDSIRCERVFAVETDFEKLLREKNVPLYTLETGMPVHELDMLGFSIGYELGITGALFILDLGGVPLLKKDRGEHDPIVIAGGCGATNPAVFSAFFDAVFIGEAEGGMFELVAELAELKRRGATRSELLAAFARSPYVWTEDMSEETCGHSVARRAVYADFGRHDSIASFMPLPNIKPVQDHGVVEIMRGCPNGCRFCHAGVYYRPQRVKTRELIYKDIDRLVNEAGYREISLTSLSSADYPDIGGLLSDLNERYRNQNVSFQLPSLKVNSFTLPILESLAEVRKSGLTFAVETPDEAWQLRLNKEVYAQHLIDIILEAKKRGWNKAKFYFMVGLPFPETEEKSEEKAIVDFLLDLQEKTRIQCNVNVGTFIPKPHTAYQWIRQISPEESERKLTYIREHLPRGKFRVSTHDIQTSYLEGLVSRGDSRASMVIYNAYKKGCRLDAWEDHLRANLPLWEEAFEEAGYDVKQEILRERSLDEALPWDSVTLGPPKAFYKKEWERNLAEVLTPKCMENCNHRCGVCNKAVSACLQDGKECESVEKSVTDVQKNIQSDNLESKNASLPPKQCNIPVMYRAVFAFSKQDGAEYISHLGQIEIFNRAILKSSLPVIYTAGFNPLPRLEFATTLSLGVRSQEEIASVVLYTPVSEQEFMDSLNRNFVHGLHIHSCFIFPVTNQRKRESLSAGLWGSEYEYRFFGLDENDIAGFLQSELALPFLAPDSLCDIQQDENDKRVLYVRLVFAKDRPFRNALESFFEKKTWEFVSITKLQTLAKPDILGWTSEMNAAYADSLKQSEITGRRKVLSVNAVFKNKTLRAADSVAGAEAISYFELYERIAAVNAELIKQRNERS